MFIVQSTKSVVGFHLFMEIFPRRLPSLNHALKSTNSVPSTIRYLPSPLHSGQSSPNETTTSRRGCTTSCRSLCFDWYERGKADCARRQCRVSCYHTSILCRESLPSSCICTMTLRDTASHDRLYIPKARFDADVRDDFRTSQRNRPDKRIKDAVLLPNNATMCHCVALP